MKKALSGQEFVVAAVHLQVEVATIKAVAEVESAGEGFCPDDFPKILFEGHVFHRYTDGLYAQSHPNICYQKWTRQFYGKTWQEERERMAEAIRLNRTAALMSTSWGKFQIMGFNFALCGCVAIQQFVNMMCRSESEQLRLFCEYIISAGLQDELQAKDWARFARLYNGPLYEKNRYVEKLTSAYNKYK